MTTSELIKLTETLPFLGGGTSREVYDLGNNLVLKVPKNIKDKANCKYSSFSPLIFMEREYNQKQCCCEQMYVEHFIWERYGDLKMLCPIVEYGYTETLIPYTIMKKADCIDNYIWGDNNEDLLKILNRNNIYLSKEDNKNILKSIQKCNTEVDFYNIISKMFNNKQINNIRATINFLGRCGISRYDLMNFENIGFINGHLVFIDYGYYYLKKYDC